MDSSNCRFPFIGVIVRALPVLFAALGVACLPGAPSEVSPEEIPDLEARLEAEPNNGSLLLRYAAALFATDQCDSATTVARRGSNLRPSDALGPMVIGQRLEQSGDYDAAIGLYSSFVDSHEDARGVAAVRAREMLARRDRSTAGARAALANEQQLTQQPADINAIAVLPLTILGDTTYAPLGRGLAQMIISDLGLLQRFRLVERLEIGALLEELRLAQTARVDQATAARLGRLTRAGRMVQGLATIPSEGETRLEASVVQADGQVTEAEVTTGRLTDLMRMEKDLVVGISARLGYQLSAAEMQLILENGTENLTAFLAYSRGLLAEDLGDYSAAALNFSNAVQADPGFQAARAQYEAAAAAPAVDAASATQVTTVSQTTVAEPTLGPGDPVLSAVATVVVDIASTQAEQNTGSAQTAGQNSTKTNASKPPATSTGTGTTATLSGIVRIVFKIP